jgi:hypothetical protein
MDLLAAAPDTDACAVRAQIVDKQGDTSQPVLGCEC